MQARVGWGWVLRGGETWPSWYVRQSTPAAGASFNGSKVSAGNGEGASWCKLRVARIGRQLEVMMWTSYCLLLADLQGRSTKDFIRTRKAAPPLPNTDKCV